VVDVDKSNADFGTPACSPATIAQRTRSPAKTAITAVPEPRIVNKSGRSTSLYESRTQLT